MNTREHSVDPPQAAILVFLPCTCKALTVKSFAKVKQRRACSEYARRHGFQVVAVVRTGLCELCHGTTWKDAIKRFENMLQSTVDVVILGPTPPSHHQKLIFDQISRWLDQGILIYSPDHDSMSREDVKNWIDSQHRPRASRVQFKHGEFDRMSHSAAGRDTNVLAIGNYDSHTIESGGVTIGSGGVPAYGTFGNVPLSARDEPLPHDGLFVRRNNAFGTSSTLGIVDLIDQGVLIDQTQIRFDDFVASNTDQIPTPAAGAGIAASHGTTAVTGNFKAHELTTHFLEIALKAATAPPDGQSPQEPMPVNFIFVVDTSGSMTGEKLDTAKTAIRELYAQLRGTDVLGIITFDTHVRTLLRATPKSQLSLNLLTSLVGGVQAGGGTDIHLGIRYGIDEIKRHSSGGPDYLNCLYVFSDGQPTSGETDWIKIRTNIAARLRGDVTLSCFGFGSDARMRELDALAGLTGGHSTFVTRPDNVGLNLAEDLTRREQLAAINIQLKIDISPEVTIWHLYGHDLITDRAARAAVEEEARAARRRTRDNYGVESLPDLISQETGVRIFAPDLTFGETYWIVFELQVPFDAQPLSLGTATVQYFDTLTRQNCRDELVLSDVGSIPSNAVLAHSIGLWTSEITFYALDDLYQNDRETAKIRLSNHIQVLKSAYAYQPVNQFRDDQVTVSKLISLAENLGRPISWSEDSSSPAGMTMLALSQFGQVRGGYLTFRQLGRR